MPKLDRFTLLFSLNSFAAAMLALYIGFAWACRVPIGR
jgi:hypothetical protein